MSALSARKIALLSGAASPSLDLNFLSGSLDPRITFTRAAGSQSNFDATGTMVFPGTNIPRFDTDPATLAPRGLLIEEARTNSAVFSQDFSNAAWATGGSAIKTAAFADGLDGTTTAARVQIAAAAQGNSLLQQQSLGASIGASQTHQWSIWVRSNTGGSQTFALKLTQAAVADHFTADLTATAAWQRFTISQAFGAGGNGWVAGVVSGVGAAAADLVVWGGQVELNTAFPTSYIPTTAAAATRAADVPTMPVGPWFNQAAMTVAAEFAPGALATAANARVVSFDDGTNVGATELYCSSAGTIFSRAGSVFIAGQAYATLAVIKGAIASNAAVSSTAYNGGAVTSAATAGRATYANLRFGNSVGSTAFWSGYLRRVRYWPRALSASELQSVTR